MGAAIQAVFEALAERNELALIPYLTGGFPSLDAFAGHLRTVSSAGADFIEVGLPFSDPVADGPTIQQSSQQALAAGATPRKILEVIRDAVVRQPVVVMCYLNTLLSLADSPEATFALLAKSGVAGVIPADLPVDEAGPWLAAGREACIDLIFLAAPTSPPERLARIAKESSGFVYAVARTGTTGVRSDTPSELPAMVKQLRQQSKIPIAAGFGIATPAHVQALRGIVDGVVVGSRLVDAIRQGEDLASLVASLKAATKS